MHLQLSPSALTFPFVRHMTQAQAESWDTLPFQPFRHLPPRLCLWRLQKPCHGFHSLHCSNPDWLEGCQTWRLLSQPRSTPWISQTGWTNIYISKDWMWSMLLLVDEKAFVVFTVCVWAWALFYISVCVQRPADLNTDNTWHVWCVREKGLSAYDFTVF